MKLVNRNNYVNLVEGIRKTYLELLNSGLLLPKEKEELKVIARIAVNALIREYSVQIPPIVISEYSEILFEQHNEKYHNIMTRRDLSKINNKLSGDDKMVYEHLNTIKDINHEIIESYDKEIKSNNPIDSIFGKIKIAVITKREHKLLLDNGFGENRENWKEAYQKSGINFKYIKKTK